jgi:hypothetical protein
VNTSSLVLAFLLQSDIIILFVGAVSAENEEMKQVGEQTESCGKEKEKDLQNANVQSEDHKLVELAVPITPPFDVSRFADYILMFNAPNISTCFSNCIEHVLIDVQCFPVLCSNSQTSQMQSHRDLQNPAVGAPLVQRPLKQFTLARFQRSLKACSMRRCLTS